MAWPRAIDYSAAIQNPSACFADAELASGRAEESAFLPGQLLSYAGNFANVYKLVCPGEQTWAVKCFTRQVANLHHRYQEISKHLERHRRKFAVEFHYLEKGIQVLGVWYPLLKMRWIEGFTLNEFLRDHAGNPSLLAQLGQLWLRLAGELRDARMAHGDLQHGNVLLVPGSKASAMVLRLIDYDGTWVPELANAPSSEFGHPNYQHPQRLAHGGSSPEIDRFSHLVIFTALRCLQVGGRPLWEKHDNGENLLFKESDFRTPGRSKLLSDLLALPAPEIHSLVGHLVDASLRPLAEVPFLPDLLPDGNVVPLAPDQIGRLAEAIPGFQPPVPPAPVIEWLAEPKPRAVPRPAPVPVQPPVPTPTPAALPVLTMSLPPMPVVVVRQVGEPETVIVPPMPILDALPVHDPVPFTIPVPARQLPPSTALPRPQPSSGRTSASPPSPPGAKPPPPPPPLPWPAAPNWLRRLGLPASHPVMRYWPVTLGVALGLPLFFLILWLFWPSSPRSQPARPRVTSLAPIEVRAGQTVDFQVNVERPGRLGPLRVQVDSLPPGVRCAPVSIPAGRGPASVLVKVTVAVESEPRADHLAQVHVHDDTGIVAQTSVRVVVLPPIRPRLLSVTPTIRLVVGRRSSISATVDTRGSIEPLSLRVEDLPSGVSQQRPPGMMPPGQLSLDLVTADDARAVATRNVRVVLLAGTREVDHVERPLSVVRAKTDVVIDLDVADEARIRAGSRASLTVKLTRHDHDGEVTIRPEELPDGVTASPVVVPAGQDRAVVQLSASDDAAGNLALRRMRIVALVEGKQVGRRTVLLRVEKQVDGTSK